MERQRLLTFGQMSHSLKEVSDSKPCLPLPRYVASMVVRSFHCDVAGVSSSQERIAHKNSMGALTDVRTQRPVNKSHRSGLSRRPRNGLSQSNCRHRRGGSLV